MMSYVPEAIASFSVSLAATDNPPRDEDHDLAESLELLLVTDTLGLVAAEPTGVVHKEDVEEV